MPSDHPLVSVVIPAYNYGRYVGEAVDSALAQTCPAVEVIVVDDGSTDDTRDRLARYGDRIRYVYQENQGLSTARNTGIRAAAGNFIAFLDADDAFHPRKLEIQMGLFASNPALGLVGTATFSDEPRTWPDLGQAPARQTPVALEEIIIHTRFAPSSAVVRKDCFDQVGLFDAALRSVEDRDMWIRIAARFPVAMVRLPLTWYRVTPGSMSRNPERMEHFERLVLRRAFRAIPSLRRRLLLRMRSYSFASYSAAWMYREAGFPFAACARLLQSFFLWPFPYPRQEVRTSLARPKLLLAALARSARRSSRVPCTVSSATLSAPNEVGAC
jgi:glycosyltransferase involved in cell wall biosynthesis